MRAVKIIIQLIFLAAVIGGGYYFLSTHHLLTVLESRVFPCSSPIAYSIGSFDARFGISQANFLADIKKAANIWDSGINKTLFAYDPNGQLKINLVYDSRQEDTDRLHKIGLVLNDDQATYNELKAKYDASEASYKIKKEQYDVLVAAYQAEEKTYNDAVSYWNGRGGAPRDEFAKLQQENATLKTKAAEINALSSSTNELVDTINALAEGINQVAGVLNLNASHYNAIGAAEGQTFEEGEYVSNTSGAHIDIYQFNDQTKLVRVLAHELGHALGLGHVSSSKSIMYYLNEAGNEKLTTEDLAALKMQCGVK